VSSGARIVGAAELKPRRKIPDSVTTDQLLAEAAELALRSAGLGHQDVDGLGVSSFLLAPDGAVDLSWKLGLTTSWLMEDVLSLSVLQHAVRAVEAGDASVILLVAGDRMTGAGFTEMIERDYNSTWRDYLSPLPIGGANSLFALLTQEHMEKFGLSREAYWQALASQRAWAATNPNALYPAPLPLDEYLAAPPVADPLTRLDCVPLAAGAAAVVVTADGVSTSGPAVMVRSVRASFNADGGEGDGLETGLATLAPRLWEESGFGIDEADVVEIYDDYPVMVLVQLKDLGLFDDPREFLRGQEGVTRWDRVNTSGGLVTCGQTGAGGTMHGLVEAVLQLRGERGAGQVEGATRGVVTNYGLVPYRYGAAAVAAVLEREDG
jgi:acetyl-CoA acetyltransferase